MSNQISQNRSRKNTRYDLIVKYSDPLSVLRKSSKYSGLLTSAETAAKRLEVELAETGQGLIDMGTEWSPLNNICSALRRDSNKLVRGVPVYEHALEVLAKSYAAVESLNSLHNEEPEIGGHKLDFFFRRYGK